MTSPPPPHAVVAALQLGDPAGACVAIKDTLDIAGWPTRAGSAALDDAPPAAAHAEAVQRLLDAGWQVVAKTTLHELAFGTTGINHHTGTALNPGWPERVPGGSSSGSASVVAAGWVPVAIGTDTGGSVRVPAACCHVFGFKPSFGRVSRRGVMPAHSTLDCVGPFATDMAWLVRAMQALDPGFGALPELPPTLSLGLLDVRADTATLDALRSALQRSPHTLQGLVAPLFEPAYQAGLAIINRETHAACAHLLPGGRIGADVAARLTRAGQTTDAALAEAEAVRRAFSAEIDALLARCDALVLPTQPSPPPRLVDAADTAAAVAMTSLVRPFNLSGHPALSLPLLDANGLPVGLQLVARHGEDARLCAIGARLAAELNLNACTGVRA